MTMTMTAYGPAKTYRITRDTVRGIRLWKCQECSHKFTSKVEEFACPECDGYVCMAPLSEQPDRNVS